MVKCENKKRYDKEGNPYPDFKDVLLDIAEDQSNETAKRVKVNLTNISDWPAVNGQYHHNCYNLLLKLLWIMKCLVLAKITLIYTHRACGTPWSCIHFILN